jgi:hypothetical protein
MDFSIYHLKRKVHITLTYYQYPIAPRATPATSGTEQSYILDRQETRKTNRDNAYLILFGPKETAWKAVSGNWKPAGVNNVRHPKKKKICR